MIDGPVYRNELVRISDLATAIDVLEEFVFEGCEIVGPVVLMALDGFQLRNCQLDSPNALWDLEPDRGYVGGVGIRACLFERCTFRRVGFAGSPDTMAAFRKDLGIT